ncbi:MAG: fatty acid desaturase [Myxococcales bacterium]|nr:MAG: fatty acid desaturase [Myxococcales bacterium]
MVALILDPRDLPFLHLMLGCLAVAAGGVALFFSGPWLWYLAPLYWAVVFVGVEDRFILMLHCTSHRTLFRPEYRRLNQVIPWLLGPFFGETPETYFVHHMGMHHPENNLAGDLSSTMRYRRDSLAHWLHYLGSFLAVGPALLGLYHWRKNNRKMVSRMLAGELGFYALVALLAALNWQATLVVFVLPVLLVRTLMMAGNWAQHAFIDPTDAANPYRNSITCINTRYNRRCFNDGYHIHHHVKPRCHWSEYPGEFESNLAEYGRQDAIVFDGIDFFQVWALLMTRRWDSLARRFVQLPGAPARDRGEVIAFLRSRVGPVPSGDLGAA